MFHFAYCPHCGLTFRTDGSYTASTQAAAHRCNPEVAKVRIPVLQELELLEQKLMGVANHIRPQAPGYVLISTELMGIAVTIRQMREHWAARKKQREESKV